jgi:hypothetical protein
MSEKYFTIELGTYGLMFDTPECYISISWLLLGLSALAITIYKIIKWKRGK